MQPAKPVDATGVAKVGDARSHDFGVANRLLGADFRPPRAAGVREVGYEGRLEFPRR